MKYAAPLRGLVLAVGLTAAWQFVVWFSGAPHYILPGPARVLAALAGHAPLLAEHAVTTAIEILLGLAFGTALGAASALAMDYAAGIRRWLMPVLVVSQAVPVFALAPLLVLWLGYGMASKVAMAAFMSGMSNT